MSSAEKIGLLVSLLVAITVQDAAANADEERLYKSLFHRYNKHVRPVLRDKDAVNVTFGLNLRHIIDMDVTKEILTTKLWIFQEWTNPSLTWNPEEFNGIKKINVDPKIIWLPDVTLFNSMDDGKSFPGSVENLSTRIVLRYTGQLVWVVPAVLKSYCPNTCSHSGKQKCTLTFGSWTYDGFGLNLKPRNARIVLDTYEKNRKWHLVSGSLKREEQKYSCCIEPYVNVVATLVFKGCAKK